MVGLQIGHDEEIIAECSNVRWVSKLENIDQYFDTLVLTNKRVYGVYQKSNGLFKKTSEEMMELSLADIKISNGQPLVSKKWDFNIFGWLLEMQTTKGIHTFTFQVSSKKNATLWEAEIYKVFGLLPPKDSKSEEKSNGFSEITVGLKGVADSVLGNTLSNQTNFGDSQQAPNVIKNEVPIQHSAEVPANQYSQPLRGNFCSNCGTKLNEGAKFCHNCGSVVGVQSQTVSPIPPAQTTTGKYSSRIQEFAGTILKCPNCGNVINSIDAVCPACGMHITGKVASETVQKLSEALMEIEKVKVVENKGGIFSQVGYEERVRNAYATYYSQKLTLIRTFPIPNTVDEIYELMLLAATNIDVKISKNTLWSKFDNSGSSAKEVSDAWIQKMKQAYKKAAISFPSDPVFTQIKNIYYEKMNELKLEP